MLNKIGKKLGYKEDGFTIIEVMIVLAVAGLIMAIVLVAIPQLQRNQRNTARREAAGRIKTEIDSFGGNNNGDVPSVAADLNGVYSRYLGCGTAATAAAPGSACTVNVEDPSTGATFTMSIPGTVPAAGATLTSPAIGTYGAIEFAPNRTCDGELLAAGSARNYAMWLRLEGGAIFCLDNA